MIVVVAGSRLKSLAPEQIWGVLDFSPLLAAASTILNGRCPTGVDAAAWAWALSRGYTPGESLLGFPADWDKWGRGAGPMRNAQMAYRADALVALLDGVSPNWGTRDMIGKMRDRRRVIEVYTLGWCASRRAPTSAHRR